MVLFLYAFEGEKNKMKLKECFRKCVMYISLQERKKRTYQKEKKALEKLRVLSETELKLEYINLKSRYEHNKQILTLFLITVIMAVVSDVWSLFQNFIQQIIKYTVIMDETRYAITYFEITLILTMFLTIIVLIFAANYMRNLYRIYKQLLLIELIQEERKENKNSENEDKNTN